ncbi:MAG TPA: hypothetical protein VLA82_10805 [Actinomycetota bacterium]|nr:hypothetical protein [Actinomycetota bacterium]
MSTLLVAATDPAGDVGPCPPGTAEGGDPRIDILEARGETIERGTALRFTIRFGPTFEAPDTEGRPLRVDVLLHDPSVPTVDFRFYRGLNRIVRFDAVPDPALQVVLLPEQGANVSLGAVALGDTVTMTLPGRLVTRDMDLEGLGLDRMRWGVIARDEGDCDALGDGRPTRQLVPEPTASASSTASASPANAPSPAVVGPGSVPPTGDDPPAWVVWGIAGGAVAALWIAAVALRRRSRDGSALAEDPSGAVRGAPEDRNDRRRS